MTLVYFSAFLTFLALLTNASTDNKIECDKDVAITGGNVTFSNGFKTGSTLLYKCPTGMYPYPVRTRRCGMTGKWTTMMSRGRPVSKATCKTVTCPGPLDFEYGSFAPREHSYPVGSSITFECYEGYNLRGTATRTCQENGKWSGTTAICDDGTGECPSPGVPIGAIKSGTSYMIEDKVTYKCDKGLDLFGSKERICLESKEWTGAEPACYAPYTFDTPEEVAASFSASLSAVADASDLNKTRDSTSFRKIKISEGGNLHIYILLDASDSVGDKEFEKEKNTALSLIEKISTYDVNPRYGIISFATEPKFIVSMADPESTDTNEVIKKLEEFDYTAHYDKIGTNTRAALEKVYEMMVLMHQRQKQAFENTQQVIVLMTDGKANMGGIPKVAITKIHDLLGIQKPSQGDPREEYLDVYAFGVGDVDRDELNSLASQKPGEKHVFVVEEITDLQETLDNMIDDSNALKMCGLTKEYKSATTEERNPWQVTIRITRNDGIENCRGAIVSEYYALTAAHCFRVEDQADQISVQAGGKSGRNNHVDTLYVHPKYSINAKRDKNIIEFYDYDIALIKLKNKLTFSPQIRPICIPCTEGTTRALRKLHPETTCQDQLQELFGVGNVDTIFLDHEKMERKYVTIKRGDSGRLCNADARKAPIYLNIVDVSEVVTPRFLCTGGIEPRAEPNTCKGDSGGALFIERKGRFIQVGVISWGVFNPCEGGQRKKSPAYARDFHTNLFEVQDWLKTILADELNFID